MTPRQILMLAGSGDEDPLARQDAPQRGKKCRRLARRYTVDTRLDLIARILFAASSAPLRDFFGRESTRVRAASIQLREQRFQQRTRVGPDGEVCRIVGAQRLG